uniref:Uncharacterized protein n=1 Tax=Chromera velia CCMP2878 TaxID=1169474 RepID=A0A0G4GAT5_9ALVE|mmetsp:Transcript_36639/g.72043  ORF Transcript_36639/g.72043 Transcript_36639/m.72043 type:complete len:240 (-) Transcript_36639:288-1007(-)|eukprot:Cvel_4426.t1-p1 / transcript=Cvel_4426.t1 / gene=Cvel_4426 / organism=Chromera_velia_CCMP2878 / gene_product=hypothetical protein / transcript_product=hypothetical protein / location=Cvel_scaffold192:111236-111952(-) / protein_length=239 / sequence_SO=supercontig / SO=protein_coding / is_pseudo=false
MFSARLLRAALKETPTRTSGLPLPAPSHFPVQGLRLSPEPGSLLFHQGHLALGSSSTQQGRTQENSSTHVDGLPTALPLFSSGPLPSQLFSEQRDTLPVPSLHLILHHEKTNSSMSPPGCREDRHDLVLNFGLSSCNEDIVSTQSLPVPLFLGEGHTGVERTRSVEGVERSLTCPSKQREGVGTDCEENTVIEIAEPEEEDRPEMECRWRRMKAWKWRKTKRPTRKCVRSWANHWRRGN